MIPQLSAEDLSLIGSLGSRSYSHNKMLSAATEEEKNKFFAVQNKLKAIAGSFKDKYDPLYGPFSLSYNTGNPVAIGGNRLKRTWAGIFKGGTNKQYSAQISFVINPYKLCLDVGFFFGRASGHNISKEDQELFEGQMKVMSNALADEITNNHKLSEIYNGLFDYGYRAFSNGQNVSPNQWLKDIRYLPEKSEIIYHVYPNADGVIENSLIDLYVAMIVSLMNCIPTFKEKEIIQTRREYKPLNAEQRAKQAERRTLIGEKGERYAYAFESEKIRGLLVDHTKYPDHVALKSTNYNFDILSCTDNGQEVHIEVKTTTRIKSDPDSNKFFISFNEYNHYKNNKEKYRLYRVYDIEGSPELEIVDMAAVEIHPSNYVGTIVTFA